MDEALNLLPPPSANISSLKQQFASLGLNAKDLVVLSGITIRNKGSFHHESTKNLCLKHDFLTHFLLNQLTEKLKTQ